MSKIFTGIIEEIGTIKEIKKGEKFCSLIINCKNILQNTKIGDSIATNGVCLTVTHMDSNSFTCDVMAETLRCTNLGQLTKNNKVNLERALKADGRFNGHIVSGHIDGIGTILSFKKESIGTWITIGCDKNILKYIVLKGSITLDGVSLTVSYVDNQCFKVCIIPHTKEQTTLLSKKEHEIINIECDVIPKYIEKLIKFTSIEEKKENNISLDFLSANGFV